MPSKGKQTFPDGVTTPVKTTTYSRAVMVVAGMSSREKANIFLPRSFKEAPTCQTSVPSIIRKRSWHFL